MDTINPQTSKKAKALGQLAIARTNMFTMIIFTVLNIFLYLVNANYFLLFSATIPFYFAVFASIPEFGVVLRIFFLTVAAISFILYVLCAVFSKNSFSWMVTSLVIFSLDTLALIGISIEFNDFSGILDFAAHICVMYYLIKGVKNSYILKHLTKEDEEEYELEQEELEKSRNFSTHTTPFRDADMYAKARIYLEGEYFGHTVIYRKVKKSN